MEDEIWLSYVKFKGNFLLHFAKNVYV